MFSSRKRTQWYGQALELDKFEFELQLFQLSVLGKLFEFFEPGFLLYKVWLVL